MSYQFQFKTTFRNRNTILDSYLAVSKTREPIAATIRTSFKPTPSPRWTWHGKTVLGTGVVPPNNQGIATPFYNQGNNGEQPREGRRLTLAQLDRYTQQAIAISGTVTSLRRPAGRRLLWGYPVHLRPAELRSPGKDSQGGFNLHLMALKIPIAELAATSKSPACMPPPAAKGSVLRDDDSDHRRDDKKEEISRAHGCRSPVRAIRSSTKAWSPSRTRTSTAAAARVDALFRSMRNPGTGSADQRSRLWRPPAPRDRDQSH